MTSDPNVVAVITASAPFADTVAGQVLIGVGVTVLAGLAVALGHQLYKAAGAWRNFAEDWRGEPSRPGFAGRPGVMERLETQAEDTGALKTQVQAIADEMPKNGVPLATKLDALWTKYLNDRERDKAAAHQSDTKEN